MAISRDLGLLVYLAERLSSWNRPIDSLYFVPHRTLHVAYAHFLFPCSWTIERVELPHGRDSKRRVNSTVDDMWWVLVGLSARWCLVWPLFCLSVFVLYQIIFLSSVPFPSPSPSTSPWLGKIELIGCVNYTCQAIIVAFSTSDRCSHVVEPVS